MKLWKKVYLLTMIIITLFVNLGFLGIVYFTYEYLLQAETERCETEFELIYESMHADIAEIEEKYAMSCFYFEKILTSYNSYFEKDTQLIGIWNGEIIGDAQTMDEESIQNGISVQKGENTVIYMTQCLEQSPIEYKIVLKKTLYEFDEIWKTLLPLYVAGGIFLSLGVSLILAMAVRLLLKPLDHLEEAAEQVKKENWTARVHIKGNDELAQLGRQFNAMAEVVEGHVEKLKEQSEQKEQLLHNMAHEMNTPITSIQGFADYMQMSILSEEEQRECLGFITTESKRLKKISSTILEMAVLEQDREVSMCTFSIKELCKQLEELYAQQLDGTSITLEMMCQIESLYGNEVLIESLLRNLMNNGIHAVQNQSDGKIWVWISEKDNWVRFIVSDNGCGIKAEDKLQIFEPFYRVDKARSRADGGSGLGLTFCKKIIDAHKGEISVESEVNVGTKFVINLPIDNQKEMVS